MAWNTFNKQTADSTANTAKLLSIIAEKSKLIDLLLDSIDHSYLQTDGTYGDLSKEVSDKVEYIKKLKYKNKLDDYKNQESQEFNTEEIKNLDGTIVNFILPRLKAFRELRASTPIEFEEDDSNIKKSRFAMDFNSKEDWLASLNYMIDYFEKYEKYKNSKSGSWKAMTNTTFQTLGECFSRLNIK